MTELEWTQRQLARANARIAELELPRRAALRRDIRKGVHPIVLLISHNIDTRTLMTEMCYMACVVEPVPSHPHKPWQEWLPHFAGRSLM